MAQSAGEVGGLDRGGMDGRGACVAAADGSSEAGRDVAHPPWDVAGTMAGAGSRGVMTASVS